MKKIIIISGPTASGKTKYSIELAQNFNGSIINSDSIQIYKDLPILSAQPTIKEQQNIEHLLFSYLNPEENCNVGLWLKLVKEKIDYCFTKNKLPIIVGGTGMYISKLINGISKLPEIDFETRQKTLYDFNKYGYEKFYNICLKIDENWVKKINKNDKQRLMRLYEIYNITGKSISEFQKYGNKKLYPTEYFFHININPPKEITYNRCQIRFKKMVNEDNCLEEINNFIQKHPQIIHNSNQYSITKTLGFLEGLKYLNKEINFDEFIDISVKNTRHYAKRQYTWFNNQFIYDYRINNIPTNLDILNFEKLYEKKT